MIHIRQIQREDHESINEIAKALHPGWFNEPGLEQIAGDIQTERGLVALDEENIVGFLLYCADENGRSVELKWIAVRPDLHRKGIGRALVNFLEEMLTRQGFQSLGVSTVAPTVEYEPFARTRSFYHAVGFTDVRIDEGWFGSGDDRLLLRKQLQANPP